MKPNQAHNPGSGSAFKQACSVACQKILAQITAAKEAVFAESFQAVQAQEHLLRLALNEAEATAFQTKYPHLVFPTLALEKIQEVVDWNRRQQSRRPRERTLALAV